MMRPRGKGDRQVNSHNAAFVRTILVEPPPFGTCGSRHRSVHARLCSASNIRLDRIAAPVPIRPERYSRGGRCRTGVTSLRKLADEQTGAALRKRLLCLRPRRFRTVLPEKAMQEPPYIATSQSRKPLRPWQSRVRPSQCFRPIPAPHPRYDS